MSKDIVSKESMKIIKSRVLCGMKKMIEESTINDSEFDDLIISFIENEMNESITYEQYGAALMYATLKMASLYADEYKTNNENQTAIREEAIEKAKELID